MRQNQIRKRIYESPDAPEIRAAQHDLANAVIIPDHNAPQWAVFDPPMILARFLALQTLVKQDRQATMKWTSDIDEIEHAVSRVSLEAGVRATARLTGLHPSTISRRAKKARQLKRPHGN